MQINNKVYTTIREFYVSHIPHILLLFGVIALLSVIGRFPYINIFLTLWLTTLIVWMAATVIFRLPFKFTLFFALTLIAVLPITLMLKMNDLAEEIGNLVYFLILLWVINSLIQYFREVSNKPKNK